jgi:hypothetical protein
MFEYFFYFVYSFCFCCIFISLELNNRVCCVGAVTAGAAGFICGFIIATAVFLACCVVLAKL